MTVPYSDIKHIYNCSESQSNYTYKFKIPLESDIKVSKQLISTGVITELTLTTDYTVTGAGESTGGYITLVTPLSSLYKIVLQPDVDYDQQTDYTAYDAFPANIHENALDRLCIQIKQVVEQLDRAIKSDIAQEGVDFTLPSPVANKLIGWNSTADGFENKEAIDADVATSAQTALTAAQTAQGLAEDARDAAIVAQEAAEAVAVWEVASQAEAEAGTDNTKVMTPLKVKQQTTADGFITASDVPDFSALETTDAHQVGGSSTTLASDQTEYTAACDGYIYIKSSATGSYYVDITVTIAGIAFRYKTSADNIAYFSVPFPVASGETWSVGAIANSTNTVYFRPLT